MVDVQNAELESFRDTVRTWLKDNFPDSLRANPDAVTQSLMMHGSKAGEDVLLWRKRFGEMGWGVPAWPRAYGGGGLSPAEISILEAEMDRIDARNPIGGLGVMMFGPTLLEFGNEEQLKQHIPPIARGELQWCQGFSEPSAGSDLASLKMPAIDQGDHFLVTGQKIWTTGAQYADWCFCLVRTEQTAKKHDGISFLLIDMHSPGVEVRPIRLINGDESFCEIFFTEVKVPKENLVGRLNGGWAIAKRLLQHERQNTSSGVSLFGAMDRMPISDIAKRIVGVEENGRLADPDLRQRLTAHLVEAKSFELTLWRAEEESRASGGPSLVSSILKNAGNQVMQDGAELLVEMMGHQGLGWEGEGFSDSEREAVRNWLMSKAGSIAGGSYEVQNNIIAKRILGLPDAVSGGASS
mgnify:CR=1 FL=1